MANPSDQAPPASPEVPVATIEHDNSSVQALPYNLNDPWYEAFVGEVEPIYCTDFETDPEAEGWTHGSNGVDEWAWGEPRGAGGDPNGATSGSRVFGLDLGGPEGDGNGKYRPDLTSWAKSPVVDVSGYDIVRLQYQRWLEVEDGFFDAGTIYVNEQEAWKNFVGPDMRDAANHHVDNEWRFQDIDLGPFVDPETQTVQVTWELRADGGLHMGGWTLDDVCVVGYVPVNTCGDGIVEVGEECDDGNRDNRDGCSKECLIEDDDAIGGGGGNDDNDGCACDVDGDRRPAGALSLLLLAGLVSWRRRRA